MSEKIPSPEENLEYIQKVASNLKEGAAGRQVEVQKAEKLFRLDGASDEEIDGVVDKKSDDQK